MLNINNKKFKKYKIPLIISLFMLGGVFLFQYLTFIPEYSSATEISTEDPITPTIPITEWDKLKYMQQMTLEACNNATKSTSDTGDKYQKQLIDIRDGKTYWVAKIGNDCWMTQNLDLDLSTSKALTPDNTNIKADWTPTENTQTGSPSGFTGANSIKSYDPGYKYYANGITITNSDETLAKDTTGQVNAHYLVGNYYSWVAAMAGNTTGNTSDNDICPKGWQLPLSNKGANAKTFQALTNALGATSGTSTGSSDSKLLSSPAYFVRDGNVDNTSLRDDGSSGVYWSSASGGSSSAYYLGFSSNFVGPFGNSGVPSNGRSVRCVAKGTSAGSTPPTPGSGIESPDVSVTVPNIITLSIDSEVVDIDTSTSNPAEGNFTATVTSNSKYNLALSPTAPEGQTPHTDLKNEDSNKTTSIPALSSTNPIITEADESWWGIKCTNPTDSTNCTKTAYTGLTLTPETYFTSTTSTPTTGTSTPFTIGIKISPSLPSGTYSTSIQVTASSTGSN